jgi:hypothetical protein
MNKSFFEIKRWLSLCFLIAATFVCASAQAPAPKASPTPRAPRAPRAPKPPDVYVRAEKAPVDSTVADDPAVNQMLVVYSPKVRELDAVLGSLKGELRKGGMGAGSLGNFVSDGMRWQAGLKLGQPIDLALINGGGLRRSTISEGELRARDIFELLPFENALVRVDLTGEQLMRLLKLIVASREAQSGARIVYFTKPDKTSEIDIVKLRTPGGEKDIDPQATYRVVTIDYIVNRGGDLSTLLREGKELQPLGITLRDAIMAYVKSETAAGRTIRANLDGRFWLDRTKSATTEDEPERPAITPAPPQVSAPTSVTLPPSCADIDYFGVVQAVTGGGQMAGWNGYGGRVRNRANYTKEVQFAWFMNGRAETGTFRVPAGQFIDVALGQGPQPPTNVRVIACR